MARSKRTKGTFTSPARAKARASARTADQRTSAARSRAGKNQRRTGKTGNTSRSVAEEAIAKRITASCLTNAHYHAGREAFLDTVHRWFMFGVVFFGAAALTDLLPQVAQGGPPWLKSALAAVAALIGALDITFDLSNRARSHAIMKRRYFELWADVRGARRTLEESQDCLDRFNADEEPPYRALLFGCRNRAEMEVFGHDALHFDIWIGHRLVKNIMRLPTTNFGRPTTLKDARRPKTVWKRVLNWWYGRATALLAS